ncbi:MAG: hypothetical protein DMD60_06345 [Gemmatimonadetes bacterium]|nr:MAG: hypothetical protein DMD60_06345 [Gemmatimonadota bacterium]
MRTRIHLLPVLAIGAAVMLGGARAVSAQQVVKLGEGETLTISGFINATLFNDRGLFSSFGQGQNAEIAAAPANQPGVNQGIFDGDVRNTRLNFTFNAPAVLGKWAPRATIEADFTSRTAAPLSASDSIGRRCSAKPPRSFPSR